MSSTIDSILVESRVFPPSAKTVAGAAISGMENYKALCDEADRDFEGFWARLANEHLQWRKPFTRVLDESKAPFYTWFDDGELNVSENCLDVHLENGNADKPDRRSVVEDKRVAVRLDPGGRRIFKKNRKEKN